MHLNKVKNSKLNNAKQKIFELKEKYSKSKISSLSRNMVTSPLQEDILNDYNGSKVEEQKEVGNFIELNSKSSELVINLSQLSVSTLNDVSRQGDTNVHKSFHSDNSISSQHEISNTPSISNGSSSESKRVYEIKIPNQLENIKFVSSSSDEYSNISPIYLSDKESDKNFSIQSNKIEAYDDIQSNSIEKEIPVEEIENSSDRSKNKINSDDKKSHTEFDPSIDEALSTISDSIDKVSLLTKTDKQRVVDIGPSQNTKILNVENIDLRYKKNCNKQEIRSENDVLKIKSKIKDLDNSDSKESQSIERSNKENLKQNSNKLSGKKQSIIKIHKPKARKAPEYKSYSTNKSSTNHPFLMQHSEHQPILKSAKLIRYTELSKVEIESLLKKANYLSSALDIEHNTMFYTHKKGCLCDEFIKQVLRNQIELTRHFIKSNHQMYLNCCKAIKVVNEKA